MKAGRKFFIGATTIVASVGLLIYGGIKDTGVYSLTPSELATKTAADPSYYDLGLKLQARVVPGSIRRGPDGRRIDFRIADSLHSYPVTYTGLVPDTFTDASDIEVIVEGRLKHDGVFHATDVFAKCGSRYEAAVKA